MERKKDLRHYWNRILIIAGITCFLVACTSVDKKSQNEFVGNNNEPYKAISVKYQDSTYRMVLRNNDVILEKNYPNDYMQALKDSGVLNIDSMTFLKLRTAIVAPQPRIDSIFRGNVDNLVSNCFDDNGFISLSLSYDEEKYLIDILYQNNILVNIACESGYLFIEN